MADIQTVIIPAAGLGTRFLPVTKAVPKELLPIGALPAIHYVADEAKASGIRRIVLVTASNKSTLADYFSAESSTLAKLPGGMNNAALSSLQSLTNGMSFFTAEQHEAKGLGHAVSVGCTKLTADDKFFTVMLPDDILIHEKPNLKLMIDLHKATGKSVVALQKVPKAQVSAYGIAAVDKAQGTTGGYYKIKSLVEKPAVNEAPSDLAVVGRYLLSAQTVEILRTLPPGKNGEIQLTDALQHLAKQDNLVGFEIRGRRLDVGNPKGLLEANLYMSLKQGTLDSSMLRKLEAECSATV